jgi:hypothetical protein
MKDCPCVDGTCKRGTKGELRTVNGDFLRGMIGDALFGDYPKPESKKQTRKGAKDAGG